MCYFCKSEYFYDQDRLNVHYRQSHYFCDVCKKMGNQVRNNPKARNLPAFEVFRDLDDLRRHNKRNHHVCDYAMCSMLVFEDGPALSAHYIQVHGKKKEVQV